jgi:hypothetical protein
MPYDVLPSDMVFSVNSYYFKTKRNKLLDMNVVYSLNPIHALTDTVSSRLLLFANFWTLKLSRTMTYLQMERVMARGWMVRHPTLF